MKSDDTTKHISNEDLPKVSRLRMPQACTFGSKTERPCSNKTIYLVDGEPMCVADMKRWVERTPDMDRVFGKFIAESEAANAEH